MPGENQPDATLDRDAVVDVADDDLYRAFWARTRRRILYLLHHEGAQSVDGLATLLVGWDATDAGTLQDADERTKLKTELVHVHLPLLDDVGLLSYDAGTEEVAIEPLAPTVEALLAQSIAGERAPPS